MYEAEEYNCLIFKNRTFKMMIMNLLLIVVDISIVTYAIYTLYNINNHKSADGIFVILILIIGCLFVVTLNTLMSNLKTITMSIDGVKIKFLVFEKFYKWDELSIKKCEDFSCYLSIDERFDKRPTHCVIFSLNSINKRKTLSPFLYATMINPIKSFELVAISLVDAEKVYPEMCYSNFNLISKEKFLSKMKRWNIEIEGIQYRRG